MKKFVQIFLDFHNFPKAISYLFIAFIIFPILAYSIGFSDDFQPIYSKFNIGLQPGFFKSKISNELNHILNSNNNKRELSLAQAPGLNLNEKFNKFNKFKVLSNIPSHNARNLASCSKGVAAQISVIQYYCNNALVSKEVYASEISKGNKNCTSSSYLRDSCICPKDHFGSLCQFQFEITCLIGLIKPTKEEFFCSKGTQFKNYYNYSLYGIPPCLFVNPNVEYSIITNLNCSNQHSTSPSVYLEDYTYLNQELPITNFHYYIDKDFLAISDTIYVELSLVTMNFKRAKQNFIIKANASTSNSLIGNTNFTFLLSFKDMLKAEVSGRWYCGFGYSSNASSILINSMNIAFEDIYYIEPTKANSINGLMIGIIIGSVLLFVSIVIFIILKCCICKKNNRPKIDKQGIDISMENNKYGESTENK